MGKEAKKTFVVKNNTHTVIKNDDLYVVLEASQSLRQAFDDVVRLVGEVREEQDKDPFPEYVVVNVDEPYIGKIMKVIEKGETKK